MKFSQVVGAAVALTLQSPSDYSLQAARLPFLTSEPPNLLQAEASSNLESKLSRYSSTLPAAEALNVFASNIEELYNRFQNANFTAEKFERLYRREVIAVLSQQFPNEDFSPLKKMKIDHVNFNFNKFFASAGCSISTYKADFKKNSIDLEVLSLANLSNLQTSQYKFPVEIFGTVTQPAEISMVSSRVLFSSNPDAAALNYGVALSGNPSGLSDSFCVRKPENLRASDPVEKFLQDWAVGRLAFMNSQISNGNDCSLPYEFPCGEHKIATRILAGLQFAFNNNTLSGEAYSELTNRLIKIVSAKDEPELKLIKDAIISSGNCLATHFPEKDLSTLDAIVDLVTTDRLAARELLESLNTKVIALLEQVREHCARERAERKFQIERANMRTSS